jgi:integrase
MMGTLYKRGHTWWIKYHQDGKAYFESAKTKKKVVAAQLLKLREGEIGRGQLPGIIFDRVGFDELAEDFLWDRQINQRGVVEASKRLSHLKRRFEGMQATRITDTHIREYIQARKDEGGSNATINRELSALKRMFNLGAKKRPPKVDMTRVPHIEMLKEDNARQGFLEYGQYLALLKALPEHLRGPVSFAYKTAWRKEEVCTLKWRQVDLDQGIVRLEPGMTKSGKGRTIYLDDELRGILRTKWEERKGLLPWVFLNADGTDRVKGFRKAWTRACKDAGVPGRLFHDLRRSGVRNMVRAGIPENTVMKISGHETRCIFNRYDIVSDADLKAAAERQAAFFDGVTDIVTIRRIDEKRASRDDG